MTVIWRCKRCHAETQAPPDGSFLLCNCGKMHSDWELMVTDDKGPLEPFIWYDPKAMEIPFT